MRFGSRVRHPAAALHLGGLLRSKSGLIYLLRDEFTTDEAAPLTSPRTCEPGPGTAGITDSASDLSISGGKLVMSGASSTGDPMVDLDLSSGVATRIAGLAVCVKAGLPADLNRFALGLDSSLDSTPEPVNMRVVRSSGSDYVEFIVDNSATSSIVFTSTGVHRNYLIVLRSVGCFFSIDGTLQWVGNANSAVLDAVMLTSWLGTSTGAIFDDLSVLSIPANGYAAWDADFSTVTDTVTSPATTTENFDCTADFHSTYSWTHEAGKAVRIWYRYPDANNYLEVLTSGDGLTLRKNVSGSLSAVAAAPGAFSDGVLYKIDVVALGSSIKVYINNVLTFNETIAELTTYTGGRTSDDLATNDLVLSTHPYPALGIATDRVVCPQLNDTATMNPDALVYFRNVAHAAGTTSFYPRYIDANNHLRIRFYDTGAIILNSMAAGVYTTPINAAAGSYSIGDDIALVLDGTNAQIFVNGVSVGSTAAANHVTGTQIYRSDTNNAIDSVEIFPRDVTNLLPSELV